MSTNDLLEFVKQQIQPMIGDSLLGKDVYSKQYFSSIIRSMYYTIPDSENVVIMYGDFNGLGTINIKFGHEAGDFAVTESLKIIREILPEGTLMCRIAGDEFTFIIPDETKNNIKPCIPEINSALKNRANDIYGVSIALAAVDTHSFGSDTSYFDLLYSAAETAVENQKRVSREHPVSTPKEILEQKFLIACKRFIDYYRFDDVQFEECFIIALRDNLDKIIDDAFNKPPTHNITHHSQANHSGGPADFPKDVATKIHNILASETITQEQVSEIPLEIWEQLFENLIKHPLTGLYSYKYFLKVLAPDIINNPEPSTLAVHLFDIMHMKLSNDLHGHAYTDEQMKIIIDSIKTSILDKNPNATFIMNGGSVIVIEEESESDFQKPRNIPKTPTVITSPYHLPLFEEPKDPCFDIIQEATKNQETLNLAHSSITCKSQELYDALEQLNLNILCEKKRIKAYKMAESDTMRLAIKTAFTDALHYYLTEFEDATTKKMKKEFLLPTLFDALLKTFSATIETNLARRLSSSAPKKNEADPR